MASEYIPQARLEELFGPEDAQTILGHLGGRETYIPKRSKLLTDLGPTLFDALTKEFPGLHVLFPSPRNCVKSQIIEQLETGVSVAQVARNCRCTTAWVSQIKRKLRAAKEPRQ